MIFNIMTMDYDMINLFFAFSFIGWVMEVIVIKRETGKLENRGFATSPFCIIYGFGVMAGYYILSPIAGDFVSLYLIGAIGATVFEYITGKAMIKIFGSLWWDYSKKPLNYEGIICLESTIGWGFGAILVVDYLYDIMADLVAQIPDVLSMYLAIALSLIYTLDFVHNAYKVITKRRVENGYLGNESYLADGYYGEYSDDEYYREEAI